MSEFKNLPGIFVHKNDGSLAVVENIPGNVTLVVGTAPDGPVDSLYLVRDTRDAINLYDPNNTQSGTLLKGIFEALENGAEYVAAYRLGAKTAKLEFVNGFTIDTLVANDEAGSKYSIAYDSTATTDHMQIIDTISEQIVYEHIDGVVSYDSGVIEVSGSMAGKVIEIGTIAADETPGVYVALEDVDQVITTGITATAVLNAKMFTASSSSHGFKPGMIVEIGATPDIYTVNYSIGAKVFTTTAFAAAITEAATADGKITFVPANSGLTMTEIEKYNALEKAYIILETAKIDMLVVKDIYLDAANLIDNEGKKPGDSGYAGVPSIDYLGTAYKFDYQGESWIIWKKSASTITPSPYEMGIDGILAHMITSGKFLIDTCLAADAEADAEETANIVFTEANFGHQMAQYLYELSVNDNEAIGVISVKPPVRASLKKVWLGSEPIYDAKGVMTLSGTGVLGYKYMSGSLGQAKGLYYTANGLVGGIPVLVNGKTVDIGRHLSVVANPAIIRTSFDGTTLGYIGDAAGIYSGLVMKTPANESTLNKSFANKISLPFTLTKKEQDALSRNQYVCFTYNEGGLVKVVDGPSAATVASDYKRLTTVRISSVIVEAFRKLAEPFLGKIGTGEILNALESQANSMLSEFITLGYIKDGNITIRADRAMAARGEAKARIILVTAPELQRIITYVDLTR